MATSSSHSLGSIESSASRGIHGDDENLEELVSSMRHPNSGLEIRDRRKTITRRTQRRCFVAKELVDWILRNVELQTYSRESAVELAQKLLKQGFFKNISNSRVRSFDDGNNLYRFTDDQNLVNIRKASLRQKKLKPIHSEASAVLTKNTSELQATTSWSKELRVLKRTC